MHPTCQKYCFQIQYLYEHPHAILRATDESTRIRTQDIIQMNSKYYASQSKCNTFEGSMFFLIITPKLIKIESLNCFESVKCLTLNFLLVLECENRYDKTFAKDNRCIFIDTRSIDIRY